MVNVDVVTIGSRESFHPHRRQAKPAEVLRPQRLRVRASQPPGWAKLMVVGLRHDPYFVPVLRRAAPFSQATQPRHGTWKSRSSA
jgi:hypothetical protein